MNKQIKQLEKIAYNLERVLEIVDEHRTHEQTKTTSYIRGRVSNWVRDCSICGMEFFPSQSNNIRCGGCQ